MAVHKLLIAASAVACALLLSASSALAGDCGYTPNHWYAISISGCCAQGTNIATQMPNSNYYQCCSSTSDEAAWLINNYNTNNAIECGWFIGYWPYGGGVYSGFTEYMTTNNGTYGWRGSQLTGTYLVSMRATNKYNCVWYGQATGYAWNEINVGYSVSNGLNWAQGEVTTDNRTWMGGGSGEPFTAYWTPNGDTWNLWGFMSVCNNSPYWISNSNGYNYSNGGY